MPTAAHTSVLPHTEGSAGARAAALAVLRQCEALVASMDAATLSRPCEQLFGGTIGQHVRHAVDHVEALLAGAETGVVDYDHRDRGTPVETDPRAAAAALRRVVEALADLDQGRAGERLRVRVMLTGAGECAEFETTFGREMAFVAHHQVHHHAMIAAIARTMGVATPDGFGKAPSTLHHERPDGA